MGHKHSVHDTDAHFSINPITKAIKNESNSKVKLMQGDHNSERLTFEIPRYVEGHDMSLCDKVIMHFDNIDSQTKKESKHYFISKDVQISPEDEEIVIFSYLIEKTATKYGGSLNFLIEFVCADSDETAGYAWNTDIYSGISVGKGIHNTEIDVEENKDLLEQFKKEVLAEVDKRIAEAGSSVTIDSELSTESTNPVQNKVVAEKFNELSNQIENKDVGIDEAEVNALIEKYVTDNNINGVTNEEIEAFVKQYIEANVSDDTISDAVTEWLEAHPEATTAVQDGSVTPNKTSFFYTQTKYTNLYDSTASTKGLEAKCNSGTESTNRNAYTSDYMPVESGKSYYIGRANGTLGQDMVSVSSWAFYDKNKNFVTQSVPSATGGWNPIPDGVAYMRISVYYSTGNNNCMVVEGMETPTKYVSYADGIIKSGGWCDEELKEYIQKEQLEYTAENLVLSGQRLEDKTVTPNKFSTAKVYSLNLANPDEVETGYKLNATNGNLVSYEYSDVSGFIPVKKGVTVYPNNLISGIAIYDDNKKFLSYEKGSDSFNKKLTKGFTPTVDGYIRITYGTGNNIGVSEYGFDITTRPYGEILTVFDNNFKYDLNVSGLTLDKWNLCDEHKQIGGNVINGVFAVIIKKTGNFDGSIIENVPHTELVALRGKNNNILVLEYDAGWNYLKTSEVVQASDKLFYYTPSSDVVNVIVQAGFLALSNPDRNKYLAEIKYASYEEAIQMQYFPVGMKGYIKNYLCDELLASDSENILRNIYNSAGLKWNCLGDSLTTNSWGHTMYNIVSDKLGIIPTNYGIVSSTIADYNNDGTTGNPMCVRYSTMSDDADIVTVMGCTNDDSSKIGTFEDTDGTTLYGACHVLFKGLVEKYPNAKIGVILPPQNGQCNPTYVSTQGGDPMMEKMSAKVSVVKKVAEFYGLPVCDLFHHGGISGYLDSSIGTTLQGDYLHLTTVGHEVLASKLMSFIKELLSTND